MADGLKSKAWEHLRDGVGVEEADVAVEEESDSENDEKHEEVEEIESSDEVEIDREYFDLISSQSLANAMAVVVEDMTSLQMQGLALSFRGGRKEVGMERGGGGGVIRWFGRGKGRGWSKV